MKALKIKFLFKNILKIISLFDIDVEINIITKRVERKLQFSYKAKIQTKVSFIYKL